MLSIATTREKTCFEGYYYLIAETRPDGGIVTRGVAPIHFFDWDEARKWFDEMVATETMDGLRVWGVHLEVVRHCGQCFAMKGATLNGGPLCDDCVQDFRETQEAKTLIPDKSATRESDSVKRVLYA